MWDDRINEIARQLTGGEPRPGFRSRVLRRVDDPPRRSLWLLTPAAAAIVLLAVVWPRETMSPSDIQLVPQRRGEARLTSDTAPTRDSASRDARPPRAAVRRTAIAANVPLEPQPASDLTIEAIEVERVDLVPVTIEALEETPLLAVDAIVITPLEPLTSSQ